VVKHRELICSVGGSTEFEWSSYRLNPGISDAFAWLTQVALRFEKYRFRKLSFEYIPRCATTTAGSISMFVDYDVADAGPVSKQELMNSSGAVSTPPWMPAKLLCDRSSLSVTRYVRPGTTISNTDARFYDLGMLYLAGDGGPGVATVVGELYVEYEVELFIPQIEPSAPSQCLHTDGETAALPLGDTTASTSGDAIVELDSATGYLRFLRDFEGMMVSTYAGACEFATYAIDAVNTTVKTSQLMNAPGTAATGTSSAVLRLVAAAGQVLALSAATLTATGGVHTRLASGRYTVLDG